MTNQFVVADPTTFEGTPYEVASRALKQTEAVVGVAIDALERAEPMILNAQLSRNLLETPEDARAREWDGSPQAIKLTTIAEHLAAAIKQIRVLERASSYDPRNPPKP